MKKEYKNLFEPFKIGNVDIKNRIVMAPMGTGGLCTPDGAFSEKAVDYYVERAKGGVGLIITGAVKIENEIEEFSMPSIPCITLNPSSFLLTAGVMTERVNAYDCKIFIQLTAGFGRVIFPGFLGSKQAVAPSPVSNVWDPDILCRELTTEEIQILVRKFGESAFLAKKAGFDGVEIHAVHEGYLIDQFTMELFNQRTDQYGGNLMGRLRFPTEIVKTIKQVVGEDFPVSLRYSIKSYIKGIRQGGLPGEDFKEMGRDTEEGLKVAKILQEAGYDSFDADAGTYDSHYWSHPPMYLSHGCYLPLTEQLKRMVQIPVMVAGRLDIPELAAQALSDRKADAIAIGRGLLADPYWPKKVKEGIEEAIRPCLACHNCIERIVEAKPLSCAVNPLVGREKDYSIERATDLKKVMVIGGGVAGMEAARVCAAKGYKVSLYEKTDHLGGNLIPGSVPDFKSDVRRLIKWYEYELKEHNVAIHTKAEVTAAFVKAKKPEVVIVATGSTSKIFDLPGMDNDKVSTASDVLLGNRTVGERVIVVGGGLVGCETALWLAQEGKKVTIVEALDKLLSTGPPVYIVNATMLIDLLNYHHVEIRTNCTLAGFDEKGAVIKKEDDEEIIPADNVIIAVGFEPERNIYKTLENDLSEVYVLGDARKVANIMYAIWDAYEVARSL